MISLTTFYTPSWEELATITVDKMVSYCERHRYGLNVNILGDSDRCHFVKTEDTLKLLDKFDIVMSIEADCLITNIDKKIEDFIDDEHDIYLTRDINGVNSGVVIWKSTDFVKDFIAQIQVQKNNLEDEQTYFEQNSHNKIKYLDHPSINSIPYEYYYPTYGYIDHKKQSNAIKPKHTDGCWQPNDFIMHLPGFSLHERIKIFNQYK